MPLSPDVPRRLVRGGVGTKPGSPKAATPLAQLMRIIASHYRRYVNTNTLTIRQSPNGPSSFLQCIRAAQRHEQLTTNSPGIALRSSTCGTPEHVRRAGCRNVSAVQKVAPQRSNRHGEQSTQGASDTRNKRHEEQATKEQSLRDVSRPTACSPGNLRPTSPRGSHPASGSTTVVRRLGHRRSPTVRPP